MRLFSCINLQSAPREHLVRALRPMRADARDLRWTDPDGWHITLGFYGEAQLDRVAEDLEATAQRHAPFGLHLRGAGSFNRKNLWIGVGGDTAALSALMRDADPEAARRRAHLTVARARATAWIIPDAVHALSIYRGPDFAVTSIDLVRSELGKGRSGGPLYQVMRTYPLEGLQG